MAHSGKPVRQFLWWCAAVDSEIIADPRCSGVDRIKHAIVGTLVCIMAIIATIGWRHTATLIFYDLPYLHALSVGLGALMGGLMFSLERLLIVSIPARASIFGRLIGFVWRALLAAFTATILTLPVVLNHYHNQIISELDDERVSLMMTKRTEVDSIFGLTSGGAAIDRLNAALDKNRDARERLPSEVRDQDEKVKACSNEYEQLRRWTENKIAITVAKREGLKRLISSPAATEYSIRNSIAILNARIGVWRTRLAIKGDDCAGLDQVLNVAKQAYYDKVDSENRSLVVDRSSKQEALASSRVAAESTLRRSDEAIDKRVTADFGAQVRALYRIASRDWFPRAVIGAFFAFFYLVDLLPLIAKLLNRSIYERLLGAREEHVIAQLDADVAVVKSKASIRKEHARAELDGFRSFAHDGRPYIEQAAVNVHHSIRQDEVTKLFEYIEHAATSFERTHRSASWLSDGNDETKCNGQIGRMLNHAMEETAAAFDSVNIPAANSNSSNATTFGAQKHGPTNPRFQA